MNAFRSEQIYPPSLKIPNLIKVFFKIVSFISTQLTLFFAAKLFSTPIKFKTPKREIPMLEASKKTYLEIPEINKSVHILTYGFSDKKILLAHGWAGRSTQLYMIAHKLLEKGFMVISFDGPAHGKSTGKTSNLLEYMKTIKAINKSYGPFYGAIGHSFGGMGILNVQAEEAIFKKLVTVGAGDRVSDILKNFSLNLSLSATFGKKLQNYMEHRWKLRVDDFASSTAAKLINDPVLVVHDALDGDVHINCAVNIRHQLKNGKLKITQGLGHTKILRDPSITNEIVTFLIK